MTTTPTLFRRRTCFATRAGKPANWQVEQGDILDDDLDVAKLGKWTFVYAWGVLHHTGDVWRAVRNAQSTGSDGGYFYLALGLADADFQPSKEFWLEVKQEYNRAGPLKKKYMVAWYVWRFFIDYNPLNLPYISL